MYSLLKKGQMKEKSKNKLMCTLLISLTNVQVSFTSTCTHTHTHTHMDTENFTLDRATTYTMYMSIIPYKIIIQMVILIALLKTY